MLQFDTAIGTCALRWDAAGLTRVHLPGDRAQRAPTHRAPGLAHAAAAAIARLLDGEAEDLGWIPVSGTAAVDAFAGRVYAATRAVGPGETTTYGAIARTLGDPGASRAVGAALGANPTPIVVPCHRVLAADGSLRGFSAPGGVLTKRRMLEIEGAPGFVQSTLFA